MKLPVTGIIFSFAIFWPAAAWPQEPGKKAAGSQEEKKANEKGGTKDDRFPDGHHHDFGKVAMGTHCKHTFRIVNTSDSPVEITSVRTAPGPVRARVSKAELQPKEEGKVLVLVETSRFVGPKTVTIFLTMRKGDGPPENFRFSITCNSVDPKFVLQIRLMEVACNGVDLTRDGLPPSSEGTTAELFQSDIVFHANHPEWLTPQFTCLGR